MDQSLNSCRLAVHHGRMVVVSFGFSVLIPRLICGCQENRTERYPVTIV
jgi:hypothetical protein